MAKKTDVQRLAAALEILRDAVREWQCVDGTSASDVCDDVCNRAIAAGLVTQAEISEWLSEQDDE